jgi:hypothetical protein
MFTLQVMLSAHRLGALVKQIPTVLTPEGQSLLRCLRVLRRATRTLLSNPAWGA